MDVELTLHFVTKLGGEVVRRSVGDVMWLAVIDLSNGSFV